MGEIVMKQAVGLVREQKDRFRGVVAFVLLSVVVLIGAVAAVTGSGMAMTAHQRILHCVCEGQEVLHVHNSDCYISDTLVCPLEETEVHMHCVECYQDGELVCEIHENVHIHSGDCFEVVELTGEEIAQMLADAVRAEEERNALRPEAPAEKNETVEVEEQQIEAEKEKPVARESAAVVDICGVAVSSREETGTDCRVFFMENAD